MKQFMYGLFVFSALGPTWLPAQESPPPNREDPQIQDAVAAYAQAFNQADAKAIAEFWSADAVYTNRVTGESVQGRAAIAKQFASLFASNKDLKLELTSNAVQFLSPSVAVEHGTARFLTPQGEPEEVEYTSVYVKRDGRWLLDRVTDNEKPRVVSHYEQLKSLEWMVGSWTTQEADTQIELDCNWTKNRNFLTRSFSVHVGDVSMSGMQVIGWDPAAKNIRSWTFDSEGTFAEATWKNQGNQWFVHNKGVLPDGRAASMVNVMKLVDDNSFTWQTVERTAAGELLPNIPEVLVVRK